MGTNKLKSYPLRMEQELRELLEEAAKENGRSMNAEIIHRLEQSFSAEHERIGKALHLYEKIEELEATVKAYFKREKEKKE